MRLQGAVEWKAVKWVALHSGGGEKQTTYTWVTGDHFALLYWRERGCIGASNRQRGLKPDSCR